jgi:hypothetical protein
MNEFAVAARGGEIDVVAVGFPTCSLGEDVPAVASLPIAPPVHLLVDAVTASLSGHGTLLLVLPSWADEPARGRIATVRALRGTDRILTYRSGLPPLAGGILAVLAGQLAVRVSAPDELLAALQVLEREMTVLAWLRSVTGLERPAPSMGQHLRSHAPGAAFAVVLNGSHSGVHTLGKKLPRPDLPKREGPVGLAVADSGADLDWLRATCQQWVPDAPVHRIQPGPLAASYWGSTPHAEAVVFPVDLELVLCATRNRTGPGNPCRWCGEAVTSSICPFCGSVQESTLHEGARP